MNYVSGNVKYLCNQKSWLFYSTDCQMQLQNYKKLHNYKITELQKKMAQVQVISIKWKPM